MGITDLVWTPANHIALLKLNPQFQAVFRWAIVWIKGQILGYDGYPDLSPRCKIDFLAEAMREGADISEAPQELKDALRNDGEFIHNVISLVCCIFLVTCC